MYEKAGKGICEDCEPLKKFSDPEIINEPIKETKEPFIEKHLRLTKKSLKKILDNHNSL